MKTDSGKTVIEEMEAAGMNVEEVRRVWAFLSGLQGIGPEGRENRIACLRALAEIARENATARSAVTRWLDEVEYKLPEEAITFRLYYLEGDARPSIKQLARCLYISTSTVNRHNKRILEAMLPLVFGIDGIFQTDEERENAQKATRDRLEAVQGTGEGYPPYEKQKPLQGAIKFGRSDFMKSSNKKPTARTAPRGTPRSVPRGTTRIFPIVRETDGRRGPEGKGQP